MVITRLIRNLVVVAALALCACTSSYACTTGCAGPSVINGEDPRPAAQLAAHNRDSIFHSFMDSIDTRIHELNDVAHRVDSLARIFKDKGRVKMHMDGKSFGPLSVPSIKIPGEQLPEANAKVPEISTPEVNVPQIDVPEIDIEENMSDLQIDGQVMGQGKYRESKGALGSYNGPVTSYREPATGRNYFMVNTDRNSYFIRASGTVSNTKK